MSKFCPNCGTEVKEGMKFCTSCGFALGASAPEPSPAPPVYTPPESQQYGAETQFAPSPPPPQPVYPPQDSQQFGSQPQFQTPEPPPQPVYSPPDLNSQYAPPPVYSQNSPVTPNSPPPPGGGTKGKSKILVPILAVVVVLVLAIGALWVFTDILPWTDKSESLSGATIQPPVISQTEAATESTATTEANTEPENTEQETETEAETQSPSFSLPLPDNLPTSPSASSDPEPTETAPKTVISPMEARDILQTWMEHHPFQLGAIVEYDEYLYGSEVQGEPYSEGGEDYYLFYISIIRLGNARILAHQETGELFHLDSPYNSVGFAPIDSWYESDHAAGAPPISAYDAWVIYDVWLESHAGMYPFTLDLHSYGIYEVDGEYYYWFRAENMEWYWFNVLVNMQPGEMLFMMISDGEEPVTEFEWLDDYYDRYYG